MDKILVYKLYFKMTEGKEILLNEYYHKLNNPMSKHLIQALEFSRMTINISNVY